MDRYASMFEMRFEAKGVRKTRPQKSFGIVVGVCLGLASVEEPSKVFGIELKMDINFSRLGQCGWSWSDRWYQHRN